jgi:excisionase family DNA binding protein
MKNQIPYASPFINLEPIIELYIAPFKTQLEQLQKQVAILSGQIESESSDFTLQDVAKKLNQSYTTVYRWVHGDKCRSKNPILKARRTGRTYRVSLEELEKFREKYTF